MNLNYLKSIGLVLLSTAFLATANLCAKLAGVALSQEFLVAVIIILPLIFFLLRNKRGYYINFFSSIKYDACRAFFAVLSQLLLVTYLLKSNLLSATLLYATGPLFIPIIARILFHTKIKLQVIISILLSFVAVIIILHPSINIFKSPIWIGLGSGFANAFSQVICHRATKTVDFMIHTFRTYVYSALLVGIMLTLDLHHQVTSLNNTHWTWLIVLQILGLGVFGALQQTLRAKAYTLVNKASSLSPFLYTSIIFVIFLNWIAFHQHPSLLTCSGVILFIFAGSIALLPKNYFHKHLGAHS